MMSDLRDERKQSQMSFTGRESRASSLQKIAGPERRTYSSLFIFKESNPIRRLCRAISESKPFDYFILTTILVNCVLLALNEPLSRDDKTKLMKNLDDAEVYLLTIFIVESILKIITQGFVLHPGAYLRSAWNILDFVVVVTGALSSPKFLQVDMNMKGGSLKAVRAVRVLRPLKLVSGIPSLQVVMKSIIRAMAPLLQITLLVSFVIVIFSIIGLEFLKGKFINYCFKAGTNEIWYEDGEEEPHLCGTNGGYKCPVGAVCSNDSSRYPGPNYGITSYDNIFLSALTVFTCITCEGWTDIMYSHFDVVDDKAYYWWAYYVTLNIIGAQFMLNLVLGVLSGEFGKERERVENRTAFLVLRQGQQMDRALTGYMDWIDTAEQALVREEDDFEDELRRMESQRDTEGNLGMTKVLTTNADGKSFRLNLNNSRKKSETWKELFRRKNRRLKIRVKGIVNHAAFYSLVMVCVTLNTVPLLCQHAGQRRWLTDLQDYSELVFLAFFITEICLKVYGLGAQKYFTSKFNKFDSVVVTAGIFEQIIYKVYGISVGISALRALRLLRLFKFTKYWSSLKNLITSLLNSMQSIVSLLFLLFLFIIIFALLGMQLFGGMFQATVDSGRCNFDDFPNAILAVFQILTGEDWNVVMYQGIQGSGGKEIGKGLTVSLYFVALVVLGNYTLLNVFLAIAVDNLTNAQEIDGDLEEEERIREEKRKRNKEKYKPIEPVADQRIDMKDRPMNGNGELDRNREESGRGWLKKLKNPALGPVDANTMLKTNTLFIFFPGNPIRRLTHHLVSSRHFDNIILIFILISSAFLALEDPTDKKSKINTVTRYFDLFFTSIFALEVVIKVINYGVILHKGSYFRDSWNFIDALVVCCAIASLTLDFVDTSKGSKQTVKSLRVIRVLRPLKAVNKMKKLKAVFQCMVYSLRNVINILMITVLFWVIFSIMGVQLFMGKFHYCTDASKSDEESCQGQYITFHDNDYDKPHAKEREWKNYEFNFDHIGKSLITLFTSSTGEGWPDAMFHAIDATEVDKGPTMNSQLEVSLFFIFFVVIFSFFFLNIFVALIILTFQEQGEEAEGDCEIDRNQRGCLHIAMEAKPAERFMPEDPNSLQYKIWVFVDSVPFEYFVMLLICGNTVILMLQYQDQPKSYEDFLDFVNDIFTFLFTAEFLLKLFALRQNYFRDGWNIFDFIIVLGSLIAYMFKRSGKLLLFDISVFRLFRAARIIKLLRRGYTIRILLWTFLQSFKALPYVGLLIGLLFFMYAIVGMQLFSLIEIDSKEEPQKQINSRNNFRTFIQAIQVLFRSATGENWQNIMLACDPRAKCDRNLPSAKGLGEYCGSIIAFPYFISFIFFCSWLMLNLFVAVIMDNFGYLTQDESILGPHHLDEFIRVWAEFDPRATGRIKHTEVCQLLRQMSPPIGLGTKCPKVVAYKRLIRMNMPLHADNTVDFTATLFALVRTALNIMTEKNNLHSNDMELRNMLKRVWPGITKKTLDKVIPKRPEGANQMTVGKIYCAKLIYENYKHVITSGRKKILNIDEDCFREKDLPNGYTMRKERGSSTEEQIPMITQGTHQLNEMTPNVHNGVINLSTPNLTNLYHSPLIPHSPQQRRSQSTYSINNDYVEKHETNTDKQEIAWAIKSGKSPYEMYGIPDTVEEDDWC